MRNWATAPARADASVRLGIETGILSTCLSGVAPSSLATAGSNDTICTQSAPVSNVTLALNVFPLGTVPVAQVGILANLPVRATSATSTDLVFGSGGLPGTAVSDSWATVNQNGVGTALSTLVNTLVADSTLTPQVSLLGGLVPLGALAPSLTSLGASIRSQLGAVAATLATPLDTTVSPLLHMLGVDVGYSEIHQMSMRCGDVQLVY